VAYRSAQETSLGRACGKPAEHFALRGDMEAFREPTVWHEGGNHWTPKRLGLG